MPSNDVISEKKKALLAYKEQILQEIKYYDKRIDEMRIQGNKNSFFESVDSSDSEDEFPLSLDCEPSLPELKLEQASLRTCLQATQELTSLQVLQSEVNVLVDDPMFEGERPVSEPGLWREVTAECRVDLVPFSMTFYVHQPERKFGPPSYRGLRVAPVKSAHEGELKKSVLSAVTTPSDAVEVLKSFAHACRSRRASLARLADKFANTLYMEPMPDGGYMLKCANLLEVSWTLQNKWSPVAPFHHRMKFDLEYMDESYIKSITVAHRQLSDPSLATDERTLLLAKIINICLEAQGPTQELYESMSSDPEVAATLKRRRTTLDREPEAPGTSRQDSERQANDRHVMAPPKTVPKKAKPKGKENMADNRKELLKRGSSDEDMNKNKKLKPNSDINENMQQNTASDDEEGEVIDTRQNKPTKSVNSKDKTSVISNKNDVVKKTSKNNVESSQKVNKKVESVRNTVEQEKAKDAETNKAKGNVASSKHIPKVVATNKDKIKLVKEKSDVEKKATSYKNVAKAVDSGDKINKAKTVKGKSDLEREAGGSYKTVESGEIINKPKVVKDKSNEKIKNVANIGKESNLDEPTKEGDEKDHKVAKKPMNKVVKEKTSAEKRQKADVEASNKKLKAKASASEKGLEEKNIPDANNAPNIEKVNSATKLKKSQAENVKPKNVTSKVSTNEVPKKKTVIKKAVDYMKSVAIAKKTEATTGTKAKEIALKNTDNAKLINNGKPTITKEIKSKGIINKKSIYNEKNPVKIISKDNGQKVANAKIKLVKDTKSNPNQAKTKSVAIVNPKNLPQKQTANKPEARNHQKTDINIENTVEKVVEKRKSAATKRKSNLLDRIDFGDNVANKKTSNNPEIADKIISHSNNVAIKRKSNLSNDEQIVSAKKRAVNINNVTKIISSDKKKPENNFQKSTKVESKFKTKLTPGSIKTAGNTKRVLSAGNIGSDKKNTKIPQKLSAVSEATMKKNPLRISPRKIPSKFKTTIDGAKSIQKTTTSIPRLMKKPIPKT